MKEVTTTSKCAWLLSQSMTVCVQSGGTLTAQQYRPVTTARQRAWPTYQTVAAPYPGYLLHFLYVTDCPFVIVYFSFLFICDNSLIYT